MEFFKKYRKTIVFSLLFLLVAASVVLYIAASPKDEKQNFRFVKVERGNIESIVSSTGVLNPVVTVQVGSQVSGTISKIFTDFNKKVEKGQLVALIDTTFLAASVRDARSSVDKAQAQYDQSVRDLNRTRTLVERSLGAQTDLETAQYNMAVARANLNSAKASLDRAKINLKYAAITAPISGTVIARNVDVGQTVAASLQAPTLFLIANDLSKMQIIASVDESDIGQIKEGQSVSFTVQAYQDKTFKGVVQQVRLQPTTVQNVVNYSVVINVDNKEGLLLPGMTATIQFQISYADNVLKVANAALRFRPTPEMIAEARKSMERRFRNGKDSTAGKDQTSGLQGSNSRNSRGGDLQGGVSGGSNFGGNNSGGNNSGSGGFRFGGGPNGSSGSRRNGSMLWYIDSTGKVSTVRVRTGLTDGQYTEVISGRLKEGMDVISAVINSNETKPTGSPLQQSQPQTGSGAMGRRGF